MIMADEPVKLPPLDPMEVLDELIAAGWGHVRRDRIPANWRELKAPKEPPAHRPKRIAKEKSRV